MAWTRQMTYIRFDSTTIDLTRLNDLELEARIRLWKPASKPGIIVGGRWDVLNAVSAWDEKSWWEMRTEMVEKQQTDFSCGLASLATILFHFYKLEVTEAELLQRLQKSGATSFADLSKLGEIYGFKSKGFTVTYDDMLNLKVPVIIHLSMGQWNHFVVLRGISAQGVWISDPIRRNYYLTRSQLQENWNSTGGKSTRILVILPRTSIPTTESFFSNPSPDPNRLLLWRDHSQDIPDR